MEQRGSRFGRLATVVTVILVLGALATVVMFAGGASAGKGDKKPKPTPPECGNVVDSPKHGKDAVTDLGEDITEVAVKHGRSPEKLAKQLLKDKTLWVEPCG